MKVLLITPQLKYNIDTPPIPLGIISIGTHLKKKGYDVVIYDRSVNRESMASVCKKEKPDIVGISLISTKMLEDAIVVSKFFHSKNVKVVWGGIFPSELPEVFLKEEYIDFVSIGEGEYTWEELLVALENGRSFDEIKGLAFCDASGNVKVNPERPVMKGEELLAPDYTLINIDDYLTDYDIMLGRACLWVNTAKGCPHQCTFCYNKAFHHCRYRRRTPESYMTEIKYILDNSKADSVFFADEIWCFSKEDMYERCRIIKESGLEFTWGCFMNVGILDAEDYRYMYECGCRLIYFGLESGSQKRLDSVKKPIKDISKAAEEIEYCADVGISPFVSFIIGFPDETKEELEATARLLKRVSYSGKLFCYFYIPYIGSELYNELVRKNKLAPITSIDQFNIKFPYNTLTKGADRNFTKVSLKELNLIYSYSLLWSFFNKKSHSDKSLFAAFSKGFKDFLRSLIGMRGLSLAMLVCLFDFGFTYFSALMRAVFMRKTAKKYGLKIR